MSFIKHKVNPTDNLYYFLVSTRQISHFKSMHSLFYFKNSFADHSLCGCWIHCPRQTRETVCFGKCSSSFMFQSSHYVVWLSMYYSSNGPGAEQEAETNSPFSHVVKHFSESLETHEPHDQSIFMFFKRFLADCSWCILDAPHALTDTVILQKRLAQSNCRA